MIRKPQEKISVKMFECAESSFKAKPKQQKKRKNRKKQKRKDQTPEGKSLYIQLTISFLIGLRRHLAANYTIIMPRTLKVHG